MKIFLPLASLLAISAFAGGNPNCHINEASPSKINQVCDEGYRVGHSTYNQITLTRAGRTITLREIST